MAGKRGVIGQGDIKIDSSDCELYFETSRGLWRITVVDWSAPGADGCATASYIGDRVAPRVP